MKLPRRVTICEVGTRDGFQIEPDFIATDRKIDVVNRLAAAGLPRIEVTSFVSPKAIPQLRDAAEVMAAIVRRPGTVYSALVPNDKGAVRAVDARVDEIHTARSRGARRCRWSPASPARSAAPSRATCRSITSSRW